MKFCKTFLIILIFGILISPLFYINTADKSVQENRTLAKFPKMKIGKKTNYEFGKDFESWLSDRFGGRSALIDSRFKTLYKINGRIENDKMVMLSDGMTFDKNKLKRFCTPINEKSFHKIKNDLEKLNNWCKLHNIKLYMFIAPEKEDVFMDKIPNVPHCSEKMVLDFVSKVKEQMNMDILYPRDLYLQERKEFTHFHTDHHWTEYGAFLFYQMLSKKIRENFPKFSELSETDFDVFFNEMPRAGSFKNLFDRPFHKGSSCTLLGLSKEDCPLTHQYAYYDHKNKEQLKVDYGPINMSRYTKNLNSKNNLKVALLGASHGGFLMPFLPYSVKEVLMLRVNNEEKGIKNCHDMKRFEKYILDFKPDILLLYTTSSGVLSFSKLY